ncbi:hypothetical protein BN1708_009903 [Verticillium longisporum]|uniref:Copper acquisition factor BIM1-like domain-containing protein n=1 Tax=Verticillium longisporum TaxID=100787 RepID=A0A0G4KM73_VERLO|nr:hypothetical protein BN1708_009903 [Verticillium longisporum]
MVAKSFLTLASAGLAAAHYSVLYPDWRADTLEDTEETGYSQWTWPCGGVEYGSGNRTDWPLANGSIAFQLGHAFNYAFINVGLEDPTTGNITSFNISLTPQLTNTSGHGTLCLDGLTLPTDLNIEDGTNASIQTIMVGPSGQAQYNCADIRLTSQAAGPAEGECVTEDAEAVVVKGGGSGSSSDDHDDHDGGDDDSASETSSAAGAAATTAAPSSAALNSAYMSTVVGLGMAVVFGLTL